ncbi:hypothetical protein L6452_04689 [Arctium lappa]|uniref:Uncharacterized protein n=1 Tax=Arctium lappa TaxID=4217 RepID=A0ACB9EE87_ARCLA|nr:hypothetical protein L6452_04689 [Arctium lappa]
MAEEQEWHREASNHVLCANNCGFFGSPTTLNLCSKCYKDHCVKEQQISKAKLAVEKSLSPPQQSSPVTSSSSSNSAFSDSGTVLSVSVATDLNSGNVIRSPATVLSVSVGTDLESGDVIRSPAKDLAVSKQPQQRRNRCGCCNRRVGLTGFTCRCGTTFCGAHRYPEMHACTFDFKAVGKEAIAKANPVIKAAKLDKI